MFTFHFHFNCAKIGQAIYHSWDEMKVKTCFEATRFQFLLVGQFGLEVSKKISIPEV